MLSACAGSDSITKGDFSLSQKVVITELNELYSYDKLKTLQPQEKHFPKRTTGKQGDDFLLEFELYMKKYLRLLKNILIYLFLIV